MDILAVVGMFVVAFVVAFGAFRIGHAEGYRQGYAAGTRAARGLPVGYRLPMARRERISK